jgi:hypothetical protein
MNDELDRLKIFRALRAEIRGSSEHLVVGIDVAKDKHHAFYGTANGKTLRKRFVFENRRADFEGLRALARDLATRHSLTKVIYGMEPTGVYHKPLLEYLACTQIGLRGLGLGQAGIARGCDHHRIDDAWDAGRQVLECFGDDLDQVLVAQHAGFQRVGPDVLEHSLHLRADGVGRGCNDAGDAKRILYGERGDGRGGVASQRRHRLDVGLDARPASGIRSGDDKDPASKLFLGELVFLRISHEAS